MQKATGSSPVSRFETRIALAHMAPPELTVTRR